MDAIPLCSRCFAAAIYQALQKGWYCTAGCGRLEITEPPPVMKTKADKATSFVKGPNDGSGRTAREFLECCAALPITHQLPESALTESETEEYVTLRFHRLSVYGGNDQ